MKINFLIEANINSTASEEENDLLNSHDSGDNNYLFDNLERDSLRFNGDDIIVGEENDLLCGDNNNYLFDNLERDSLTNSLRSDSFFTDIYENNNQNDIFDSNQ